MSKISTYPDGTVTLSTRLIGTDDANADETKNFSIASIIALISSDITQDFVPYTGAASSVNLGAFNLSATSVYASNIFNALANPALFVGPSDGSQGMSINTTDKTVAIGDVNGAANGTRIVVDDLAEAVFFTGAIDVGNGVGAAGEVLVSAGPGLTPLWQPVSGVSTPDATALVKGKLQLTGDLGGTAASPTVPGLANRELLTNKSIDVALGTSNTLYPSQNAVKVYVDNAIAGIPSGGISGNEFYIHDCEDGLNVSGTGATQLLSALINPTTGVVYTNASAAAKFPFAAAVYGVINVATFTYDDVVVMEAFQKSSLTGKYTMLKSTANKTYRYNQGGFLIANEKASVNSTVDSKIFIVDLQGTRFVYGGAAAAHTCFKKEVLLAELPTALDRTLVFVNVNIDGDNFAGSKGFEIVGGRSCLFQNIEIKDYETGFHGGSLLQSRWTELRTSACETGFHASIDLVVGATPAEAVWQPILENCRFRGITTTTVGCRFEGVEFPKVIDCGWEGSDMLSAVVYDNQGNTVAKKVAIIRPRMEINASGAGTFTGPAFDFTGSDYHMIYYEGHEVQNVTPNFTLIRAVCTAGTVMCVMKDCFGNNSNNRWKLSSPPSTGFIGWDFNNVHLQGNPTTPANVLDTIGFPDIWVVGEEPTRTPKISPRIL